VATLAFVKDARLRLALDADHTHVPTLALQPVKVTPAGAESLKPLALLQNHSKFIGDEPFLWYRLSVRTEAASGCHV
jgi:hypothetical protein